MQYVDSFDKIHSKEFPIHQRLTEYTHAFVLVGMLRTVYVELLGVWKQSKTVIREQSSVSACSILIRTHTMHSGTVPCYTHERRCASTVAGKPPLMNGQIYAAPTIP